MAIFENKKQNEDQLKKKMKSPRAELSKKLSVDNMLQWISNKKSPRGDRSQTSPPSPPSPPLTLPSALSPLNLQNFTITEDGLVPTKPLFSLNSLNFSSSPPQTPTFTLSGPEFLLVKGNNSKLQRSFEKPKTLHPLQRSTPLQKVSSMDEVEKVKLIGVGSSSKVYLVRSISELNHSPSAPAPYTAMKVIAKEENAATPEDEIMSKLEHPLIVTPLSSFEDDTNRYIHMPYVAGGELFFHMQKFKTFDEKTAQFYAAEIACALEYIHSKNICYRDLKPENILLSNEGHIQLIDFGTAQFVSNVKSSCNTVGTLEYLAPEVLKMKKHQKEADWWALGVLIYEMLTGHTPFHSPLNSEITKLILDGKIEFPPHISENAKSVIKGLLTPKTHKRLGCDKKGVEGLKNHPFFVGLDWTTLLATDPPIKISLEDCTDTKYFPQDALGPNPDPIPILSPSPSPKPKLALSRPL